VKKILSLIYLIVLAFQGFGQTYTISGTIKDNETGEDLIGASIYVSDNINLGTSTNEYGFFSLTIDRPETNITVSYVGYQEWKEKVDFRQNKKLNINLLPTAILTEVVILSERGDEKITNAQMGTEKLDVKEIAKLPVIFGEKDILKTIQLLPGIKSAGEGNAGFFVRGGSADQNLILLDEAPVYNASHLLGFFSTFNSDAIKDVVVYKGNSPAQFGGRLSSVLDIKMKEGNNQKFTTEGGIGLISSRLSLQGPIQKDQSSFLITGRRTYADLFLQLSPEFKDNQLYFYDLNAKANYKINENNRIFLSGYFGKDILKFGDNFGIDWGNTTGTIRWNSLINKKLFSNTSLIYSNYDYNVQIGAGESTFNIYSRIKNWNIKQEYQYFPSNKNSWRFGINSIHHDITPSRFQGGSSENSLSQDKETRYGWENAIYANNTRNLTNKLSLEAGLRLSSYSILGSGDYNLYTNGIKTGSETLESGTIGKTYVNLEPRTSLGYRLTNHISIKTGYARNTQNLHLLSNSTTTNPTDQWIGNSYNVKPEISDQLSLGYFQNFKENKYEFSTEVYYKDLQNQVDYKNGADINTAPDVESELLFGKGRAYGVELFLKKKTGKFTGWISYTLSRSERKIDGINNNNWYLARQDRLHDISIVGSYQITPNWNFSGLFVFATGNAVTFPSGKYSIDGNTIFNYTERNGYRMPDYHRLDISATYEKKTNKRFQSSWNFGLYNVYGRENAWTINFEDDPNNANRTRAVQTALFKWVPSVTYNFKF
jgi:hypothetical protein